MVSYSQLEKIFAQPEVAHCIKNNPIIASDYRGLRSRITAEEGSFNFEQRNNPAEAGAFFRQEICIEVQEGYNVFRRDLQIFCDVIVPSLEVSLSV